ncbi:hypothetical protein LEP1GSC161_3004 [Leptospira santarosai str. CBC1416]|uniref:Uncharacterized protein n=1 Tax=Leptospira santarosai str. CBC1416 TaxID=1193059 RepID=M6W0T7_9LEPT|nr:hypothetical protein LEP1GSC161_3004 [Leptospira santarosai str. CBC1416]
MTIERTVTEGEMDSSVFASMEESVETKQTVPISFFVISSESTDVSILEFD